MSQQDNFDWKRHDIYEEDTSFNRTVTRSQIPFATIKNSSSDLKLFADQEKHSPPGKPHLMTTLKGQYGAVPRTTITRKLKDHLPVSETLIAAVDEYKISDAKVTKNSVEIKGKESKKSEEKVIGRVKEIENKTGPTKKSEEKVIDRKIEIENKNGPKKKSEEEVIDRKKEILNKNVPKKKSKEKVIETTKKIEDESYPKLNVELEEEEKTSEDKDEERKESVDDDENEAEGSENNDAKQDEDNEKDEKKVNKIDSNEDDKGKRSSILGLF